MDRPSASGASFPLIALLAALLGVSLGLNVFWGLKVYHPRFWQDIQLARIRPPDLRPSDHLRGPESAPVTVIEYSDFQCPFCAMVHPSLAKLADEGKIKWAFRHFPLFSIHPLATDAAEAAECAAEKGKFWQYADALYAGQRELQAADSGKAFLADTATHVGINGNELTKCVSSGRFESNIRASLQEGISTQIDATPTLFINGKRHEGALTLEQLEQLVSPRNK